MSFQEFATNFIDELKNKRQGKNINARQGAEKFISQNPEAAKELKQEYKEISDEDVTAGFAPQWLTQEKKLTKTEARSSKQNQERFIMGEVEAETDDAILLDDNELSDESTNADQWIPKSQFDEFGSSGPELSSSKREKAEDIMESRSKRAQNTDKRNAAPIAESFEEWKKDPSETDLPGIDTLGSGDDFDDLF